MNQTSFVIRRLEFHPDLPFVVDLVLKGTPSQDVSWPGEVEDVQFHLQALCGGSISVHATSTSLL